MAQDTPQATRQSFDLEKDNVNHIERMQTNTPPSEVEKGQPLAPVATRGPEVHEKVRQYRLCMRDLTKISKDEW